MKAHRQIRGVAAWIGVWGLARLASAQGPLPAETELDRYVRMPDDSYAWQVVSAQEAEGMKTFVVDMTSQTWRAEEEVDRTQWRHWMTLAVPDMLRSDVGLLVIGGGRNGAPPPTGPSEMPRAIARATGTVVAELRMVPNQPLTFHQDGRARFEDDLIGYTWDQFLRTGDAEWPAQNPMVKSAVRAMDTMSAVAASEAGGGRSVERFVVTGGSKRGWTAWLTGAVDDRVVGIAPTVIDVLNIDASMRHHIAAYGFWAPAVGDYVQHKIMERMKHPRMQDLHTLVDPYPYRHRLTMPKLVLNATGDQFFLPDSSRFYWDDLPGPKYLRYVPNSDHGLGDTDAVETLMAFYAMILNGALGPRYSWSSPADGTLVVRVEDTPREVRLWQASNPAARDFRVETLGRAFTSRVLQPQADGLYVARVEPPAEGWTAYFVELTFDVGLEVPLKLTTGVSVAPDVLPYPDKDPTRPATLTAVFTATDEAATDRVLRDAAAWVAETGLAEGDVRSARKGDTGYVNWRPIDRWADAGKSFRDWLGGNGGDSVRFQLESGDTITTQ